MALKMQNAVDQITDQFHLPGGPEFPGLGQDFAGANEDVTAQHLGITASGVVESDDVSNAGVAQKGFIEADHLSGTDQVNAQLEASGRCEIRQEAENQFAKEPQVDGARALVVAQGQLL